MAWKPGRIFSQEFKEAVVLRIVAGERVYALAEELHIKAQVLYRWWSNYDAYGVAALRQTGRPRRGQQVIRPSPVPKTIRPRSARGRPRRLDADETATRIAELERKVGEQALEIDFFERALRHIKAGISARGAGPSSPSSGR